MTTISEDQGAERQSMRLARRQGAFGPAYPDYGWVPSPRYIMRRDRIMRLLADMPPGRAIEVGCATGALLSELADMGFSCTGLETSPAANRTALSLNGGKIRIAAAPDPAWQSSFDYLFAFEVIEHIEDDVRALADWAGWLKPGGLAVISAPADPDRWNGSDVWAGHFRRYARSTLAAALDAAGFVVERIETYGFPLANMIESMRAGRDRRYLEMTPAEIAESQAANSARSGVDRSIETRLFPYYARFPGSIILHTANLMQRAFLQAPWGNGLIAIARKREAPGE
ncbi:MAG: methyltransferase domain-containing protein [Alphaproteobacteria bacterium]|nr:methyltransferase domain-containing protein [Alphaproteobacteria bacterium]